MPFSLRLIAALLFAVCFAHDVDAADAPALAPVSLNYQGRLEEGGDPVNASRWFRAQIFQGGTSLWQSAVIKTTVSDGLYAIKFTGIPSSALSKTGLTMRVSVAKSSTGAPTTLQPDVPLIPALQADVALSVAENSVGSKNLVNEAVTTEKISIGAVTAEKLAADARPYACLFSSVLATKPYFFRVLPDKLVLEKIERVSVGVPDDSWSGNVFHPPVKGIYAFHCYATWNRGSLTYRTGPESTDTISFGDVILETVIDNGTRLDYPADAKDGVNTLEGNGYFICDTSDKIWLQAKCSYLRPIADEDGNITLIDSGDLGQIIAINSFPSIDDLFFQITLIQKLP
jgi:hypothetical protein